MSQYEINQKFNFINRYLHSFRYKQLLKLADKASLGGSKSIKILDLGSGNSRSYSVLKQAGYKIDYHGVEIFEELCESARSLFDMNADFNLHIESAENWIGRFDGFDLIIAQESFEHMPPLLVSRIIDSIGKSQFGYLLVTVPVEVGPSIFIKNVGSFLMRYPRYKEYSWKETMYATFYRLDGVARHSLGHKGFDWRWLSQTLRLNVKILETIKSPVTFLPSFVAPSIGFICTKDPG